MLRSQSHPDRVERRTVEQTEAKISLYTSFAHPSYEKRIIVEHAGNDWTFGIDSDETASLMSAVGNDEIPEWVVLSFQALGVKVEDS